MTQPSKVKVAKLLLMMAEVIPSVMDLSGECDGESFKVRMEGLKCDQCGFQTIDSTQSSEFTRLVSDAYRESLTSTGSGGTEDGSE